MGPNRVFLPQTAVDLWLAEGRVEIDRNQLLVKSCPRRYRMIEAVHVLAEVSGAPDEEDVVGKVKTVTYLAALGAELLGSSMVLGDNAYDVVPGWMGTPVFEVGEPPLPDGLTEEGLLARYLPLDV